MQNHRFTYDTPMGVESCTQVRPASLPAPCAYAVTPAGFGLVTGPLTVAGHEQSICDLALGFGEGGKKTMVIPPPPFTAGPARLPLPRGIKIAQFQWVVVGFREAKEIDTAARGCGRPSPLFFVPLLLHLQHLLPVLCPPIHLSARAPD